MQAVSAQGASPFKGLTERNPVLGGGYTFLVNKYYLDALYEKVIVHAIAHPIAKAAYWINQHVIDGIVNGVGIGGRKAGDWVYKNIDQRVVDGAVNGSGAVARGTGGGAAARAIRQGQQYGALLFGAAAVGALVLVTRQQLEEPHARRTSPTKNWLLSVGMFLPLVGVLVMLFIPKTRRGPGEGRRHRHRRGHARRRHRTR